MTNRDATRGLQLVIFLIFAILTIITINKSEGRESPTWEQRFSKEAEQRWELYERFAKRLHGTISYTKYDLSQGKRPLERRQMIYKQGNSCALTLSQGLGPEDTLGNVLAQNTIYAFRLNRRSESSDWVLDALDTNLSDGVSVAAWPLDKDSLRSVCPFYLVYNRYLPEWVKEPEFNLKRIVSVQRDEDEVVRVEFDYNPPKSRNTFVRGGWMILDPNKYWSIREYEVRAEWPDATGSLAATFDTKDGPDKFPITSHYVRRHRGRLANGGQVDHQYVHECDFQNGNALPEKEFTLSAFGLPEPKGLKPVEPPRTWLWLMATAVGVGLLAILFAWLKRRAAGHTKSDIATQSRGSP